MWDPSTLFWTLVVSGASTLFYAFAGTMFDSIRQTLTQMVQNILFQHYSMENCMIDNAPNMEKLIQLLQDCGYSTRQRLWKHDMSGQGLQYGVIRLPAKSILLCLLTYLEVTHYVWIKHDLSQILFVGDSLFVQKCVITANGMINGVKDSDRCIITTWYESKDWQDKEWRFFLSGMVLYVSSITFMTFLSHYSNVSHGIWIFGLTIIGLSLMSDLWFMRERILAGLFVQTNPFERRPPLTLTTSVHHDVEETVELRTPLVVEDTSCNHEIGNAIASETPEELVVHLASPKNGWWEVVTWTVPPREEQSPYLTRGQDTADNNFLMEHTFGIHSWRCSSWVTSADAMRIIMNTCARQANPKCRMYIVPYNPFADPGLKSLNEVLLQGPLGTTFHVLLVLPSFQTLTQDLECNCGEASLKCPVHSFSAVETWLQRCCSHEFCNLNFFFMSSGEENNTQSPVEMLFHRYTVVREASIVQG